MTKLANLQSALEITAKSAIIPAKPQTLRSGEAAPPIAGNYTARSRAAKTALTTYLSPDFKSSLRLIQAKKGGSFQDLVAEALNDLFAKYDVPIIR